MKIYISCSINRAKKTSFRCVKMKLDFACSNIELPLGVLVARWYTWPFKSMMQKDLEIDVCMPHKVL
jgi:hypothetical protein